MKTETIQERATAAGAKHLYGTTWVITQAQAFAMLPLGARVVCKSLNLDLSVIPGKRPNTRRLVDTDGSVYGSVDVATVGGFLMTTQPVLVETD